jgi:hypothetical protein
LKFPIVFLIIFFCSRLSDAQIPGSSLILNGTSDYVEVPTNASLNITSNFSVEAWIYPCDITGYRAIVNKHWCAGNQSQFHFAIRDGFLEINWDDDGNCGTANSFRTNTAVVSTSQWYHVAFVHTNSSITLYLNGNPTPGSFVVGGNSSILSSSTSPYRIGVYQGISGAFALYFKGRIDEVRMWNIALTSPQILSRYNSALTGSEAGLVAYHNMEITGTGQNITVPNSAVSTGSVNNGKTIGTSSSPFFQNNSTILNCSNICAVPSINFGKDTTLCTGYNLILNPGAGFLTYKWQDNSTNDSFNVVNPGKYWVTVQNTCGFAADTINISYKTTPIVNLGNDIRVCTGTNILLNAKTGFSSYKWQDNSIDSTFNVITSGKYWVTVQNICGLANDTIKVIVDINPNINLGNDSTLCLGNNLSLNPGPGFTAYDWQDNSINGFFNVANPGKYWVTVQNTCGSSTDTINISYKTIPTVNFGNDIRACTGTNILLNARSGFSAYQWQDNSTDSTFGVINSGKYWVRVQNICGFASDTIYVTLDINPNINLGNDTTLCLGNNLSLNPGQGFTAYTWQDNSTNDSFNVVNPGKYWVNVQNTCGFATDTISIELSELFIPNLITPNADNHNDSFEITNTNDAEIGVEFLNIWGSPIYKNINYKNDWGGNNLDDGMYYYIITDKKCNKDYKGWFHVIK